MPHVAQARHASGNSQSPDDHLQQIVQCDLIFVKDKVILHLIDEAIRWTLAQVIPEKSAKSILNAIHMWWIRIFGPI
eukprot:8483816-Heterocapsa_arctica.AAC.1